MGIITITILVEIVLALYAAIRNDWVYDVRIAGLDSYYKELPSYEDMLIGHGFWRWDIKYFIRNDKWKR